MVVRTATTLTRVLLRVYPPSFRNHVGHEVLGDVRRRATELSASHGDIRVGVWLVRHGASLVANAVATWRDETIASVRDHAGRPRATFQAGSWVPSWLDLKLAVRMLGKYPGLALVGGLGIAVGVAVGAASSPCFTRASFPKSR
jgi:hypothetical protein